MSYDPNVDMLTLGRLAGSTNILIEARALFQNQNQPTLSDSELSQRIHKYVLDLFGKLSSDKNYRDQARRAVDQIEAKLSIHGKIEASSQIDRVLVTERSPSLLQTLPSEEEFKTHIASGWGINNRSSNYYQEEALDTAWKDYQKIYNLFKENKFIIAEHTQGNLDNVKAYIDQFKTEEELFVYEVDEKGRGCYIAGSIEYQFIAIKEMRGLNAHATSESSSTPVYVEWLNSLAEEQPSRQIDFPTVFLSAKKKGFWKATTPLIDAISSTDTEAVLSLLDRGANPNKYSTDGTNPLLLTMIQGPKHCSDGCKKDEKTPMQTILDALLKQPRLDWNARELTTGMSALHLACLRGDLDLVGNLLTKISPHCRDYQNNTPLDLLSKSYEEVQEILYKLTGELFGNMDLDEDLEGIPKIVRLVTSSTKSSKGNSPNTDLYENESPGATLPTRLERNKNVGAIRELLKQKMSLGNQGVKET